MNAARQLGCFVGVTGLAVNLGDVVRMGIFLDVCVAIVALQAAVDAGAELLTIHRNAMPGGILHGLIAMTGEAICLRDKSTRRKQERDCDEAKRNSPAASNHPREVGQPIGWLHKQCDEECCDSCGFGHAAVFFLHAS